jgi:Fe2+ or Zn2+ uptake regulation protein
MNNSKGGIPDYENRAIQVLRRSGQRVTNARIQVLKVLAATPKAVTANDIHQTVLDSSERIDLVSVYRILSALQGAGLVQYIGTIDAYAPRDPQIDRRVETSVIVEPDQKVFVPMPVSNELLMHLEALCRRAGATLETVRIEISARTIRPDPS